MSDRQEAAVWDAQLHYTPPPAHRLQMGAPGMIFRLSFLNAEYYFAIPAEATYCYGVGSDEQGLYTQVEMPDGKKLKVYADA